MGVENKVVGNAVWENIEGERGICEESENGEQKEWIEQR